MEKVRRLKFILLIVLSILMSNTLVVSQGIISGLTTKDIKSADKKILHLKRKIANDNKKYLNKLRKKEDRILKKMCISNPKQADAIFGYRSNSFANFGQTRINSFDKTRYSSDSSLDSLLECMHSSGIQLNDSLAKDNYTKLSSHISELKMECQKSNDLKRYSNRRIRFLKDQSASSMNEISSKITKSMSKESYYFKQQLNDRKELFTSRFGSQMSKFNWVIPKDNGMERICSLDKKLLIPEIPKNWGAGFAGIDSLQKVEKGIVQQIRTIDSINPGSAEKKVKAGVEKISYLKDQSHVNREIHSSEDLPDFKPNPYKTKRLIDRIELGYDFRILPATFAKQTVDGLGVNVIYHISPKNKLVIGGNCRMQIQNNFHHFSWKYNGVNMELSLARQILGKISALCELDRTIGSRDGKAIGLLSEKSKSKIGDDCDFFTGIQCEQRVGNLKSTISVLYKLRSSHDNTTPGLWAFRFGFGFGK